MGFNDRDCRIPLPSPGFQEWLLNSGFQEWLPILDCRIPLSLIPDSRNGSPIPDSRIPLSNPGFQDPSPPSQISGPPCCAQSCHHSASQAALQRRSQAGSFPGFSLALWSARRWQRCHPEYLQPLLLLSLPSNTSSLPFYHMQEPLGCLQVLLPVGKCFISKRQQKSTFTPCYPSTHCSPNPSTTCLQPSYTLE